METTKEEEVDRGLKYAPLAVGTGAVESDGVYAKRTGVFEEVLKDRKRLMNLQ